MYPGRIKTSRLMPSLYWLRRFLIQRLPGDENSKITSVYTYITTKESDQLKSLLDKSELIKKIVLM